MTKAEEGNDEICRNCGSYQIGYCVNSKSDHFGHAIAAHHPACEEHS